MSSVETARQSGIRNAENIIKMGLRDEVMQRCVEGQRDVIQQHVRLSTRLGQPLSAASPARARRDIAAAEGFIAAVMAHDAH